MTDTAGGMHRLVLLRHAKAESAGSVEDVLRPLALNGRRHAGRVGESLLADGLVPDLVLRSSAVRTRQTWDLAAANLGDAEPEVRTLDDLYTAGPADLLRLLNELDSRMRTVLVVGHEPTMAATAERLASQDSDQTAVAQVRVGVPTATYSVLESGLPWQEWAARTATLVRVHRPAR
ncbi:phosphohistidine phosphatase [Paraoerskovia sediminicola]|uniref:Phosphohistidine phosphatase n=1 Tax=Paraoerskovia sediminicola TaxID=1138587 RepID=A0ABN6XFV4_9CELL|nr:histidine phosphatase family protein [Paraoerskovia sediminicola]BDZ43739.1 phosphohistidine phosphatase [Paraoerskovia sediminicola]